MTSGISIVSKISSSSRIVSSLQSAPINGSGIIDLSSDYSEINPDKLLLDLHSQSTFNVVSCFGNPCGMPELRETIAHQIEKNHSRKYSADKNITITPGATSAISLVMSAFIKENDEILVFEPFYSNYIPPITLNGGIPVFLPLKDKDFNIDWNQVKKAINGKTRMIILNSPHNPTGKSLTAWDIAQLSKILNGSNIIILADEVFAPLVYDNEEFESLLRYPDLMDRTIVVQSFSKTLAIAGWRLGYCVAGEKLSDEIRKLQYYMGSIASIHSQWTMNNYLRESYSESNIIGRFERLRNMCSDVLEPAGFKITPTSGSFFQLIDYSNLSKAKEIEMTADILTKTGVALLPLSQLYRNKTQHRLLRLNFAREESALNEALNRLAQYKP